MNPPRVVEQYPRSLEAQLLRAGRAVNAPDSTFKVTLGALGLGATATAAASASGAVHAKTAGLFGTLTAKWTAIAILVASGIFVAAGPARWLHTPARVPGQPQGTRAAVTIAKAVAPPAGVVIAMAQPASVTPGAAPLPLVTPRERLPSATMSSHSLGAEVALIDAARQALKDGQAARALTLLEQHDRQFKKPRLAQEATLLRARALEQQAPGQEPQP